MVLITVMNHKQVSRRRRAMVKMSKGRLAPTDGGDKLKQPGKSDDEDDL